MKISYNEFHISRNIRQLCDFDKSLFASSGNVIFKDLQSVKEFQVKINALFEQRGEDKNKLSAGSLNAMGLIDEIFHYVCMTFRRDKAPESFKTLTQDLYKYFGNEAMDALLLQFMEEFPPVAVYQGKLTAHDYLIQSCIDTGTSLVRDNREQVLEELILLHLANENPAFAPFKIFFDDSKLQLNSNYIKTWNQIKAYFITQPVYGPFSHDLITLLKEPVTASPESLKGQLDYIRQYWQPLLGEWLTRLLTGIDTLSEEEKAMWHAPSHGAAGGPDMAPYSYDSLLKEYERFSPDRDWMPKVVLMAKTVLVWLDQLSKKYKRIINRLDMIPDEELDELRNEGFTGLWLIGLWERSYASKRIKQLNGNKEAAASAYSLWDYEIAQNLGGWEALENLRYRCGIRGIRLASDMVPNHTGIDGKWVAEHPDYFITTDVNPFPQYTYTGENLSQDPRISIYLEDHYYSKTDCAVCFKRVDNSTGQVTYIYHGNDGTGLPWNDTAQIDYLNPTAREAVMQQILKVARNFPIIRFDAAMVLAKKHIRRLWYPEPGHGGDIATRSQWALSNEEFESRIPNEFWREVVDRCAKEMPDTLLLAEAFWMMEGYFTRTLGMHRVYNSAFMNMLKKEENQKYRDTVKNTIKFDPQILKRFVNFMNNPDEETAVAQFGKGDKYFGVCTLMVTMPGLPMFGHGQIEGFEEKYGMEYTKAYRNESPDKDLYARHCREIFPLLHKRYLFAQIENFLFYDVWDNGQINENIYAYSNGVGQERTVVFYNNKYDKAQGWIKTSCQYAVKTGTSENDIKMESKTLAQGLLLTPGEDHFCILKEHRTGLYYIRKSDDIINNGMFVSLNGFESQVYIEVHQVTDTEDKKYSTLNQILNGRGVSDLDTAWEEYHYKELYETLSQVLDKDFYDKVSKVFTPLPVLKSQEQESLTVKEFCQSIKNKVLCYFEKESVFAQRESTDIIEDKKVYTKEERDRLKSMEATPLQRFTAFQKSLEFLEQICLSSLGIEDKGTTKSKGRDKDSAFKTAFDNVIYQGLTEYKNSAVILTSFALVASAGSDNLLKWNYPRKLSECLKSSGISDEDCSTVFKKLFVLMDIKNYNFANSFIMKSYYDTASLLVTGEYSYLLTGANEYDNIRWFNKEAMDSSLWYGLTISLMRSTRIKREQLFKLFKTLKVAKDNAEYRCDKFIATFVPEKPRKIAASSGTKVKKSLSDKTNQK